ncbi:TIM barrel protein [Candidatus Pelagibacter communis]|uniref:TIM barrel protein n=1 Tax=Candidatus Pelagibacter TaxID=198251 RepID=UPI003EE2F965
MEHNKVFVSTGYYKNQKSIKTIKRFLKNKIKNIELSGGKFMTRRDLIYLEKLGKSKNLRVHNYYPPPKEKFVINLASQNKSIIKKSLNQLKKSITLSKKLNSKFFSFHGGFRIDPQPRKLGKQFDKYEILSKKKAETIFLKNIKILNKFAKKKKVKILIENNVINKKNLKVFGENPLLLTNPIDILRFFKKTPKEVGLLLDLGHLKVSAKTEKFNLRSALKKLNNIIEGYHLSENNSLEDQNKSFDKNVWFLNYLKKNLEYYTLEIYTDDLNKIKKTEKIVEKYLEN